MENKRGGKREGAGRKKGFASVKAEESRKYVARRIEEELEPILSGQIEMAKGIYTNTDGNNTKVYKKLPDSKVAEYLLNQLIGRPRDFSEIKIEEKREIDPADKARIDRILGIN